MERLYSNMIGTPVVEDDEIRPFTSIKDLIIDPDNGSLVAILVDINKNLIITAVDVYKWGDVLKVGDRNAVIEGKDVLRVEEIQKRGRFLPHSKVYTKNGVYLGKIIDFSLDSNDLGLRTLFVAKDFLGLLRYGNRLISFKDIVEVLPGKVIVKNDLAVVEEDKEMPVKDMAVS